MNRERSRSAERNDAPATDGPFRICGACGTAWDSWRGFIDDPALRTLGLQVVNQMPEANLLVFEHRCGSSVSVLARRLRHLLPGLEGDGRFPVLFATPECHLHCQSLEDHATCDRPCANARDRRLLRLILERKNESP